MSTQLETGVITSMIEKLEAMGVEVHVSHLTNGQIIGYMLSYQGTHGRAETFEDALLDWQESVLAKLAKPIYVPQKPAEKYEDIVVPEDEEEEGKPRHRIRRYKKEAIMRDECDQYVMAGKRLPKLHSRWLYNRYINCYSFSHASMGPHNRMVDELRETKRELSELKRKIAEAGNGQEHNH